MKMLAAATDDGPRKVILRQLAAQMVEMEALEGLMLVRKLPAADQPMVLGEWVVGMVLAGKLVNARIAAEGAPTAEMRAAVAVLDLAGRVAHGEKTFADAQAASGKTAGEFLQFVAAMDWSKVKNLDPNVASEVLKNVPAGLARAAMEIGMAKNFIQQRRFKSADAFANIMVRDLQPIPLNKIPPAVFMDIAGVLAGVGKFGTAKTMFEQGLSNNKEPLTIDSILSFFDALIAADGGDLADRLTARMPPMFQDQISRLWARHYIKKNQPEQIREILSGKKTAEARAWVYVGVATGLQELGDKSKS
jgi:hypothetical protein